MRISPIRAEDPRYRPPRYRMIAFCGLYFKVINCLFAKDTEVRGQRSEFRVQSSEFGVQSSEFGVQSSEFRGRRTEFFHSCILAL